MKIASSWVKSSPASTNADGDPRPQSITNTRSSTTSADEIPARPATGSGAPAVPRRTSSVAMVACAFVRVWVGIAVAGGSVALTAEQLQEQQEHVEDVQEYARRDRNGVLRVGPAQLVDVEHRERAEGRQPPRRGPQNCPVADANGARRTTLDSRLATSRRDRRLARIGVAAVPSVVLAQSGRNSVASAPSPQQQINSAVARRAKQPRFSRRQPLRGCRNVQPQRRDRPTPAWLRKVT